jgi:CRP/FNR family transcriptional regulator, cyclic AMP receptor protein
LSPERPPDPTAPLNPAHALLLTHVGSGDAIASDRLLAEVEPEFIERLNVHGRLHELARGELLYEQGDPAEHLYLVARGAVAVTVTISSGQQAPVAVLGRPALFGSAALLRNGSCREATVTAVVDTAILAFPADQVMALLDDYPVASAAVRSALVRQVLELSDRVVESLHLPASDRIRRRLVALAAAHPGGEVPITQQELAGLTGTSRATVNAVLAEEVRAGTVTVKRAAIQVLDLDALRDAASS